MNQPDTTTLTLTRHLPVPLDQYRKNALAEEMALQRMEEIRISDHLKRVTESLRVTIKEAQRKQTLAANAISQGYEMREVSCRQEIDEHSKMVTVRLDTGVRVEERALTVEEMMDARKRELKLKS